MSTNIGQKLTVIAAVLILTLTSQPFSLRVMPVLGSSRSHLISGRWGSTEI